MIIGQLIKEKRNKLSLSQKELALKLSISIQRLNNFETGLRVPPLSMLDLLTKTLDFDIINPKKKYNNNYKFNIDLFKDRLSLYRTNNNLTLLDLSNKLNISRQTLSKYEKGESLPNIDDYYKMCEDLNVSPTYFICDKLKSSFNYSLLLKYLLPTFSLIIICFIIFNPFNNSLPISSSVSNDSSLIYYSNENSNNYFSTQITPSINKIEITSYKMMDEDTIKLINLSNERYDNIYKNNDINRPYKISFNGLALSDIPFYYNESIRLPMYFDDEKFIDHYIDQYGNKYINMCTINQESNIYLSPVYVTYEEYINSLSLSYLNDNTLNISSTYSYSYFIIPSKINEISNFVIDNLSTYHSVYIINEVNAKFDFRLINHIPNFYYINAKNIEFYNQDLNKVNNIKHVAINQKCDYLKTTDFISTELLSYLYLDTNNVYSNFINFNDTIEKLVFKEKYSMYFSSFIKGDVKYVHSTI